MGQNPSAVLALDVGDARVGVAIASLVARLPRPLITLPNDEHLLERLRTLIAEEAAGELVVGLPRGLDGQDTAQTASVRRFAEKLLALQLPIRFQDEAATSVKAEAELRTRGKIYSKGEVDALAATYILEDYLNQGGGTQ